LTRVIRVVTVIAVIRVVMVITFIAVVTVIRIVMFIRVVKIIWVNSHPLTYLLATHPVSYAISHTHLLPLVARSLTCLLIHSLTRTICIGQAATHSPTTITLI
jgi:hypothetical protein